MRMNISKFTLGAVAGITTIAIAIPVFAQFAGAQSLGSSALSKRPVPSQTCVTAMATLGDTQLASMDSMEQIRKTLMQAHVTALKAAALIADDTQREAAVKKATDDMRTGMKAAMPSDATVKASMDALRTACGDVKGGMGGMMGMGFGGPIPGHRGGKMMGRGGPDSAALLTKLGMTQAELKAAIDGGKTIEQIATEKGITLPAPPHGGKHRGGMMRGHDQDNDQETNDDGPAAAGTAQSAQ